MRIRLLALALSVLCTAPGTGRAVDPVTPQVEIEARITEITPETTRKLGFDWQLSLGANALSGGELGTGLNVGTAVKKTIPVLNEKPLLGIIDRLYAFGGADYTKLADASTWCAETGIGAEALLKPLSFRALNRNFETKILVEASLNYAHVGEFTKTEVTGSCPFGSDRVEVKIDLGGEGSVGAGIAIGGLIRQRQNNGVPGLRDIPILGAIFKARGFGSDRNGAGQSELLVLLTAKIVR